MLLMGHTELLLNPPELRPPHPPNTLIRSEMRALEPGKGNPCESGCLHANILHLFTAGLECMSII